MRATFLPLTQKHSNQLILQMNRCHIALGMGAKNACNLPDSLWKWCHIVLGRRPGGGLPGAVGSPRPQELRPPSLLVTPSRPWPSDVTSNTGRPTGHEQGGLVSEVRGGSLDEEPRVRFGSELIRTRGFLGFPATWWNVSPSRTLLGLLEALRMHREGRGHHVLGKRA
jgi:hypothetical protein